MSARTRSSSRVCQFAIRAFCVCGLVVPLDFFSAHAQAESGIAKSPARSAKPNVIFILADDSGFADFGCYGHPYARTPNIDRLAREGTRFTQFYATGVTCCPSRTGLMTSKWPASFSNYPANGGFGD